jgi:isocitrate/isopropylmalate dehydrogenase
MATHHATLVPGGGPGPELPEASRRVLEAAVVTAGSSFDWDGQEAGVDIMQTAGMLPIDPTAMGTAEYADAIIAKLGS